MVEDMIAWLKARQAGVTQARNEAHDSSVRVLNGAEVNRVLDFAQLGLTRVIDAVLPQVNADMVTYSSYDSTAIGNDANSMQQAFNLALQTIEKLAPDPLGMGNRRILISEYGMYENQLAGALVGAPPPSSAQRARQESTVPSCGTSMTTNACSLMVNPRRLTRPWEIRRVRETRIAAVCGSFALMAATAGCSTR